MVSSPVLQKRNLTYTQFCHGIPASCPYAVGAIVGAMLAAMACAVFWCCGRGSVLQTSLKDSDFFADKHPREVNGK